MNWNYKNNNVTIMKQNHKKLPNNKVVLFGINNKNEKKVDQSSIHRTNVYVFWGTDVHRKASCLLTSALLCGLSIVTGIIES